VVGPVHPWPPHWPYRAAPPVAVELAGLVDEVELAGLVEDVLEAGLVEDVLAGFTVEETGVLVPPPQLPVVLELTPPQTGGPGTSQQVCVFAASE